MKVLDLRCANSHRFEGWFASEDDFQRQLASGWVTCPVCSVTDVVKLLTAPRLNLRSGREPAPSRADKASDRGSCVSQAQPTQPESPADGQSDAVTDQRAAAELALQAQWMQAVKTVLAKTEDVGERFADEARAMHHGEVPSRSIRGRASVDQAMQLLEEGIEVLPLPDLPALKSSLH